MSVDSVSVLAANGIDPQNPKQFAPDFEVLMVIKVADLHSNGMQVVRRPLADNPAHCNVLGVSQGRRKYILGCAEFLRRPSDVVKANEPD